MRKQLSATIETITTSATIISQNSQNSQNSTKKSIPLLIPNLKNKTYHITHNCIGNNTMNSFCFNKSCQNSDNFFCNDQQCKCYQNHESCPKVHIKKLLKKIQQKLTINTQQLKAQVKISINSIIKNIQQQQKRFLQEIQTNLKYINLMNNQKSFYDFFILSQKQKKQQFNAINLTKLWQFNHQNSNNQQITQELTNVYIAQMKLNQKFIEDKIQFTKKEFFKIITMVKQHTMSGKVDKNVIENELKLVDVYNIQDLKERIIQLQKDNEKIQKQCENISKKYQVVQKENQKLKKKINDQLKLLHHNPLFPTVSPSSIVKTTDQLQNLIKFFTKNIKSINVAFKASQHNFSLARYYQKCGHLCDTIVICQTTKSKILGGYSPLHFTPTNLTQNQFISDPSSSSFIFSLTNNHKFQLKQKQKSIYRSFNKSCIKFGANNSLSIQNQANKYSNCQTGLYTKTYINQAYKENKQSYELLNGNQNQFFMVKEWEVLKVQFE